jgi:FMN phosphatase YigB (HAD superfamily)
MYLLVDLINTSYIKDYGWNNDLISAIKSLNCETVIVSNISKDRLDELGLTNNMPFNLFTLESNPRKTDRKYFDRLIVELGCEFKDLILIEHNPEVVVLTQNLGIHTVLYKYKFTDTTETIEKIKNHLI